MMMMIRWTFFLSGAEKSIPAEDRPTAMEISPFESTRAWGHGDSLAQGGRLEVFPVDQPGENQFFVLNQFELGQNVEQLFDGLDFIRCLEVENELPGFEIIRKVADAEKIFFIHVHRSVPILTLPYGRGQTPVRPTATEPYFRRNELVGLNCGIVGEASRI